MMKDEDPSATAFARTAMTKRESSEDAVVGNRPYRFWWVISAIVLLALWSMFTGSDSRILDDIDVLELKEKEKMVRRMWVCTLTAPPGGCRGFGPEAFEAAYEELASEVRGVREAAVSEIARMWLRSSNSERVPPLQPKRRMLTRMLSAFGKLTWRAIFSILDLRSVSFSLMREISWIIKKESKH